ncbi:MAG: site-2 protease family protein [Planctomycetes bacterium]|nr:site-2 protease family protein [Planctomycetota bacterium]
MASASPQPTRGPFGARTLVLGRVFGIEVGLDPTWFVLFAFVTLGLGKTMRETNADWPAAWAWGAGLAISLIYFLSIVAHEFGHSLVSIWLGVPVRAITLFLLGGIAMLEGEPRRPRDEFLVAVAGPMVSVVLGLAFLLLSFVLPEGRPATEVASYVGQFNLVVVAFNLLPGFPLDGGRVFRALLWAWTHDQVRATRWAANVGGVIARLFIGLGLALVLFGGEVGQGLMLAVIGWFLLNAARAHVLQLELKHQLGRVTVAQAMEPLEPRVDEWTTLEDLVRGPFALEGAARVWVEHDGRPAGVVEFARAAEVPAERRAFHRVTEAMTPVSDLDTMAPDETLYVALERLERGTVPLLLVARDGELLGALSRERITRVFQNRLSLKD